MDLFIFRCPDCGRVGPEYEWGKGKSAPGMGRGSTIAFPKPICPDCGSVEVDINHDLRETTTDEEESRVWAWRKVK